MTLSQKQLEAAIAAQLVACGAGKTICPSEVARALQADWRGLMPDVRAAGRAMAKRGEITVTQRGVAVNACTAKGPIRFGLLEK